MVSAGVIGRAARSSTDAPGRGQSVMHDFRSAVYYPAVALLDGNNPYDKADYIAKYPISKQFPPYSPLTLLINLPFAAFPLQVAQTIYLVTMLALALLLAHASLALAGVSFQPAFVLALGAVVVSSRAGQANFTFGQSALQLALATLAALHLARSRPWLAALGVAFVTVKVQYALPLVVWMLARRDYAAVTRGVVLGVAGALAGAAVLVISSGSIGAVTDAVGAALSRTVVKHGAPLPSRIDTPAVITFVTHHALRWKGSLAILGTFLVAIGAVLRWGPTYRQAGNGYDLSAVLISLAVLSMGYHHLYDTLVLVPALVALVTAAAERWRLVPLGLRWPMAAAMALPLFNYTTGDQALSYRGSLLEPLSRPLVNGVAIEVALALCILACLRRPGPLN